jgi:hypothetical protein
VELTFSPKNVEGLEHATPNQLSKIEISPSGFGLYFPMARCRSLLAGFARRRTRLEELDGCATWSRGRP